MAACYYEGAFRLWHGLAGTALPLLNIPGISLVAPPLIILVAPLWLKLFARLVGVKGVHVLLGEHGGRLLQACAWSFKTLHATATAAAAGAVAQPFKRPQHAAPDLQQHQPEQGRLQDSSQQDRSSIRVAAAREQQGGRQNSKQIKQKRGRAARMSRQLEQQGRQGAEQGQQRGEPLMVRLHREIEHVLQSRELMDFLWHLLRLVDQDLQIIHQNSISTSSLYDELMASVGQAPIDQQQQGCAEAQQRWRESRQRRVLSGHVMGAHEILAGLLDCLLYLYLHQPMNIVPKQVSRIVADAAGRGVSNQEGWHVFSGAEGGGEATSSRSSSSIVGTSPAANTTGTASSSSSEHGAYSSAGSKAVRNGSSGNRSTSRSNSSFSTDSVATADAADCSLRSSSSSAGGFAAGAASSVSLPTASLSGVKGSGVGRKDLIQALLDATPSPLQPPYVIPWLLLKLPSLQQALHMVGIAPPAPAAPASPAVSAETVTIVAAAAAVGPREAMVHTRVPLSTASAAVAHAKLPKAPGPPSAPPCSSSRTSCSPSVSSSSSSTSSSSSSRAGQGVIPPAAAAAAPVSTCLPDLPLPSMRPEQLHAVISLLHQAWCPPRQVDWDGMGMSWFGFSQRTQLRLLVLLQTVEPSAKPSLFPTPSSLQPLLEVLYKVLLVEKVEQTHDRLLRSLGYDASQPVWDPGTRSFAGMLLWDQGQGAAVLADRRIGTGLKLDQVASVDAKGCASLDDLVLQVLQQLLLTPVDSLALTSEHIENGAVMGTSKGEVKNVWPTGLFVPEDTNLLVAEHCTCAIIFVVHFLVRREWS